MSDRINPSTMVPTYGAGRIIMIFFAFIPDRLAWAVRDGEQVEGQEWNIQEILLILSNEIVKAPKCQKNS